MKSIEQLKKLSTNPFYKLTEEEQNALNNATDSSENKKKVYLSRGNAAVKQIGKLEKHSGDPEAEK